MFRDGEVVVPREVDGRVRLDWESLNQRIHSGGSRVKMLVEQTPAHFIGFDALATGEESLMNKPFHVRRELVEGAQWCHVTRITEDPEIGTHWLTTFEGAGLDGVIAKRLDGHYLPGKREMIKVGYERDADCVAIGYRIHKSGAASFSVKDRAKMLADPEPLREGDHVTDREPSSCTFAQLEVPLNYDLSDVLGT